jgi:hypothetical protein
MMHPRALALVAVVACVLSTGSTLAVSPANDDGGHGVLHEVETAGLCGNALLLLEQGDVERAEKLLELHLRFALRAVDTAPDSELPSLVMTPHLVEGIDRAVAYSVEHGDDEMKALAAQLHRRVHNATEGP